MDSFTVRFNQPPLLRWLEASALFAAAFALRDLIGWSEGASPFLTFYPAILIAALLLGWQEAGFILLLSLAAGLYFFLPNGMLFLPVGWMMAALNIAIIVALKSLALDLAIANERQRILFQELQHRVANTLQSTISVRSCHLRTHWRLIQRRQSPCWTRPFSKCPYLRDAPSSLRSILFAENERCDAVTSVLSGASVELTFHVEELDLSLDQLSIIAYAGFSSKIQQRDETCFSTATGFTPSGYLGCLAGRMCEAGNQG